MCTESCTDPLGDECPGGWRCRRPDEVDALVCVCEPTSVFEICNDDQDNDCNGKVDDCLTCGAALVSPNSTQHCGECGRRCIPGSSCDDGECVCGSNDPNDCVLDEGDAQCERDDDCEDGVDCTSDFCQGGTCFTRIESGACDPGESCEPLGGGCTQGQACSDITDCFDDDPCTTNERCDFNGFCVHEPLDLDVDGVLSPTCGGFDCNDNDGSVAPGAPEQCDGIDNTCDSLIDEPLSESACGDGASCVMGSCGCEGDLFDCGNAFSAECADLTSDPRNCGSCGLTCGEGFDCIDGGCVDIDECETIDCPSHSECVNIVGSAECRCSVGYTPNADSSSCVDFDECTITGANCSSNASCHNTDGSFACECLAGYEGDGVTCNDFDECEQGDEVACGGHGTCQNLAGSYTCSCDQGYGFDESERRCVVVDECAAGLLEDYGFCGGQCTSLLDSALHCGGCNMDCDGGFNTYCELGECFCDDSTLTYCDLIGCVNTDSDARHCGDCHEACPASAGCIGGECFCPAETHACGDACVAFGTTANCLDCGDACPELATCEAGGCTCPAGTPDECGGECVNTATDERYCGDCDTICPDGATCAGGECACPSERPDVCEADCVDLDSSEVFCGNCNTDCSVVCNEGSCQTATQVVLGSDFGCVLFTDDQVACFGLNARGQLGRSLSIGVGSTDPGLLSLTNVRQIAANYLHACAVDTSNALRCWGANESTQLGSGTTDQTSPVSTRTGIASVVVGAAHTCAIRSSDGAIECIGSDADGQRGDGGAAAANGTWTTVSGLANVDKLVSGHAHLCALNDGLVSCWGSNSDGQIGIGTSGNTVTTPMQVIGLTGVDDIDAGSYHTCAIVDGAVYCWGLNSAYQTGAASTASQLFATQIPSIDDDAVALAVGDTHSCVLRDGGVVTCWGSGNQGESGRFSNSPLQTTLAGSYLDVAAGGIATCGRTSGGDVRCWGDGPSTGLDSDSASARGLDF
jgi:alpha-tubulin suppressor-like RCC1 family protein